MLHEWGDPGGRPLLFFHGFMGSGADWEDIAAALGAGWRVLAPDLPGHGQCPMEPGPGGYTMEQAEERVLDALGEQGIGQCPLVGYSMGGRFALWLAMRHPERFHPLVLESASPGMATEEARQERRLRDERLARKLEAAQSEAALARFLDDWHQLALFKTLARRPDVLGPMLARRLLNDPGRLAASLRGMGSGAQPNLWPLLPVHQIPTLLLVGSEDPKFQHVASEMCRRAPAMRMHVIFDCSHNVHAEQPADYTAVLKTFLARHGQS